MLPRDLAGHGAWPLALPHDHGEAAQIYQGVSAPLDIDCPCSDPDTCPDCDSDAP